MKKLLLTLAIGLLVFGVTNAQDNNDLSTASHSVDITIPEIFVVDVEATGGEATALSLTPDITKVEAGSLSGISVADSSLTLNYTSIVSGTETRNITVALNSDMAGGLSLELTAQAHKGTGNGVSGAPTATLTLSSSAQNLITGIGTEYTGDGNANGFPLKFELKADATGFSSLTAGPVTRTITYTITDL